jgi:thymidine kinase
MMRGRIEAVFGPMYAGKTSELLKRILWLKHQNLRIEVIKPKIDNRYAADEIVTHTGQRFPCYHTKSLYDLISLNPDFSSVHTIFIDELQFFALDDVKISVDYLTGNNVNIVAAGLDQDSAGEPFDSSAYVLALADDVKKIRSFCSICGQPATKTFKMSNTGSRVEVGSVGVYEARCLQHWEPNR